MLDTMKSHHHLHPSHQPIRLATSKSIANKSSHYPYSTRNPYDDGLFFIAFCEILIHRKNPICKTRDVSA